MMSPVFDIQSWWEVPSIAHFCSLFRAAFNLLDFDIEELEEALLTDGTEECASSLLTELIVRLLRGCLSNNDVTASNYQMFLRRLFRQKCQETGHSNIFNADIDFQFLPLRRKVQILQALCDFRLSADDVFDLLKNLEAESLRVEPLGWDDNGSAYWYFYGTRLYREDYVLNTKGKKRNGKDDKRRRRFDPDHPDKTERVWQVVCFTEDDWLHITDKFKGATSRVEKDLFMSLSENFLPEIPRLFQEKERLRRKRLLESLPRRTSSRVQKIKQKEENQKQDDDVSVKDDAPHKDSEQSERENRARQRELKRSQSCSSRSGKSRSPSHNPGLSPKHRKKASRRHTRRNSVENALADNALEARPSGRQTNNSLACATGQILIPDRTDHPNSTRKKVKTSQIFGLIEEDVQTDMYKVLKKLKTHGDAWPFINPVEEDYAPNYYSVIRRPMDLRSMEDRLDQGYYTDFTKFQSDFNLIVNNCRLYNGQDNEYTEMVDKLEAAFIRLTQRYFDCLSSTDEEIAVEYPFQNPSPRKQSVSNVKHERHNKPNTVEIIKKRKRDSSIDDNDDEEDDDKYLMDRHKEKKLSVSEKSPKESKTDEKFDANLDANSDQSVSSLSTFIAKAYLKKKKRKLKNARNSKKRHKDKHGSKKSKEKRKHSKHSSKRTKKKKASRRSSLESHELADIYIPVHESKETKLLNLWDTSSEAVFFKDKYDKIKERRRGSSKTTPEKPNETKVSEKPKSNMPAASSKIKNMKLKETIEKLKAKSEKQNDVFDDYFPPNIPSPKKNKKCADIKSSSKSSESNQPKSKKDEYEFIDDIDDLSESKAPKKSTKGKIANAQAINTKNESATEALEQAAKSLCKLFDDTPKHSEYSSNSNSPSQMSDDYMGIGAKIDEDIALQLDKDRIQAKKDSAKKRLMNRDLLYKVASRKKDIQRTIERLQPGKAKGNLISNVPAVLKQDELGSITNSAKNKEIKNAAIVKTDEAESPKLSLGTVLNTVAFGIEKQHNFTNEAADRTSKVQVVDTGTMTCDTEEKPVECEKTIVPAVVNAEPPKEETESDKLSLLNQSQEKATPNLSAWFKAFGAPKGGTSKKKPDESDADDSKSNDTTNDVKTPNVDNPKNDHAQVEEVFTPEGNESPIPSVMTSSRIRRTSTGSSVSERSSFSQDLDSPRHQPSHTSPMLRSPASPRTDDHQKNLYPPMNGPVRVGFYQDTASVKSSPEKSCSPREAPLSPYPAYSQHVYAISSSASNLANQNNFIESSSKSPLPGYGQTYYDTLKSVHSGKPIRTRDDYSVFGSDSLYKPPQSPLTAPFSPAQSSYSQHSQHSPYSLTQHSPQTFVQVTSANTPAQSYETKHMDKTSMFPVKKRTYSETTVESTDLTMKSPLNKTKLDNNPTVDKQDMGLMRNVPTYDTKGCIISPNYFHTTPSVIISTNSNNSQKLQYQMSTTSISEPKPQLSYDSCKESDNSLQSLKLSKEQVSAMREQYTDMNAPKHPLMKKQYDFGGIGVGLKPTIYDNLQDMSKHQNSNTDLKNTTYSNTKDLTNNKSNMPYAGNMDLSISNKPITSYSANIDLSTNGKSNISYAANMDLSINNKPNISYAGNIDLTTNNKSNLAYSANMDLSTNNKSNLSYSGNMDLSTGNKSGMYGSNMDLSTGNKSNILYAANMDLSTSNKSNISYASNMDLSTINKSNMSYSSNIDLSANKLNTVYSTNMDLSTKKSNISPTLDYSNKLLDSTINKSICSDPVNMSYLMSSASSSDNKLSPMNAKLDASNSAINKSHRGFDYYNVVVNSPYSGMMDINASQSKNMLDSNETNQRYAYDKLNANLQYQNLALDSSKRSTEDIMGENLKKRTEHISKHYSDAQNSIVNDNYNKNIALAHQNITDWKLDCGSKPNDQQLYNVYKNMSETDKSCMSESVKAAQKLMSEELLQNFNASNMCDSDVIMQKPQTELRIPMCGIMDIPLSHKQDLLTTQAEFTRVKNVMSMLGNKQVEEIYAHNSSLNAPSNSYKTSSCHSPLSMDASLRNYSGLNQMMDRYKDERLMNSYPTSSQSAYEKNIPLAHMYQKNAHNSLHTATTPNQMFTTPLPMAFNRDSLYLSNIQSSMHNLSNLDPMIQDADKKSRGRKKKSTPEVTSTVGSTSQTYHSYAPLKTTQPTKAEQPAPLPKTSNIVPGSAFNFGPPAATVGLSTRLYQEGPNFLEELRNSSANYNITANYIAAATAAAHRSRTADPTEKCAKPDMQPPVHGGAADPYRFLTHPQVRPGYPFLGVDHYPQLLQRHQEELFRHPGAQIMGIFPSAYQSALGVRQPYDTMNRPSWL